MGCITSAVPHIDLDPERIAERNKAGVEKIIDDYPKQEAKLKEQAKKAGEKGYAVPDTKIVLIEGKSVDRDFKEAAATQAAVPVVRQDIKNQSWDEFGPEIRDKVPADLPEIIRNKAIDEAHKEHDKIIDSLIDKAMTDAITGANANAPKK